MNLEAEMFLFLNNLFGTPNLYQKLGELFFANLQLLQLFIFNQGLWK